MNVDLTTLSITPEACPPSASPSGLPDGHLISPILAYPTERTHVRTNVLTQDGDTKPTKHLPGIQLIYIDFEKGVHVAYVDD